MILVTGGKGQGKRRFSQNAFQEKGGSPPVGWCDGGSAHWNTFMKESWGWNFHLFIRRVMLNEVEELPKGLGDVCSGALPKEGHIWTGEELSRLSSFLVGHLMRENPGRVLVTDDIGSGIVPADYFERIYREETGRICCQVAGEAEQVWRVCCGLGQRLK